MPALHFEKSEERFNVSVTFDKVSYIEIPYKKLTLTDLTKTNEIIVIDTNEDPFQVTIEETKPLENQHVKNLINNHLHRIEEPYVLLLIRNSNNELAVLDEPLGMCHNVNTLILASAYFTSKPLEAFYLYRVNSGDIMLENIASWDTISV